MRTTLLACGLSLWPVAPGSARPFEDGVHTFERGDYVTALRLWRPLAEQGDARAQFNLGLMYAKGRGVPRDYAVAAEWFRRAAGQGLARAQFNFGVMYATGQGVPQDDVLAHKWLNLAASRFPASETKLRDKAVKARKLIARRLTPAQIAEAQRLAREWKPKKMSPRFAGPEIRGK